MMESLSECMMRKPVDYKSQLHPIWCPGCGSYGVLTALTKALAMMNLDPENVAVVSGIGCSSRLPGFVSTWGFHGVHGRALPIAIGVKTARPDLTVIVTSGDGDAYSIGAGHLPHAARRNADITALVVNNAIYGLTKGQVSPTSHTGFITKSSPYGNPDHPINPLTLAIAQGATFVARGYSASVNPLAELIVEGIRHKGFSLIDILAPCVTHNKEETFEYFKEHIETIDSNYDPSNRIAALELSLQDSPYPIGVIYREDRKTMQDHLSDIKEKNLKPGIQVSALFEAFK